ncbi:hypothetical protein F5B18DRAFT_520139 [Nemania serpens]|nr:hypothetical protein F5B18DRAFT_520139 [Nemania serpens]
MQQEDQNDAEVGQVGKRCVSSPHRYLFVVGPPRSGKSTRLPVIIAAASGKKVICVQPDDWVARYHAEWLQLSSSAKTYGGKSITVGYCRDDVEMPPNFYSEHDLTYVSYRWLYRMVVDAGSPDFVSCLDNDQARRKIAMEKQELETKRKEYADSIGYIILDEVHAQSITQELGYTAAHAATSGLVQGPAGFSSLVKIILTTAYPESRTFVKRFGLSEEAVQEQTITIGMGLAPTRLHEIREQYHAEDANRPRDCHEQAVKRATEILGTNKQARILILMDTMHSSRNIARQSRSLRSGGLVLLDLETEEGRAAMLSNQGGQVVVLATPSFASRIPVQGITDVICPRGQLLPILHPELHRDRLAKVELVLWELAWAKNHLDPACPSPTTIHYMFPETVLSNMHDFSGARFRFGDLVDAVLGLVRLCPEQAFGPLSPFRFEVDDITLVRATRQLLVHPPTIMVPTIQTGFQPVLQSWFQLDTSPQIAHMMRFADVWGLDRLQAFFFGLLKAIMSGRVHAKQQRFISMVAVAMVVFDENPILRQRGTPRPFQSMVKAFPHLKHYFSLGKLENYTSDAWVNAVVWMHLKRQASQRRQSILNYARSHHTSTSIFVDDVPLTAAEPRLRSLARMLELDEASQDALCGGTFLSDVESANRNRTREHDDAVGILWVTYMETYKFNLVYIAHEEGSVKVFDLSSHSYRLEHTPNYVAIDMVQQTEIARGQQRAGFYATATLLTGLRLRGITVIPLEVVLSITDGDDKDPGAVNLNTFLTLD